jgi:hypothetical protein
MLLVVAAHAQQPWGGWPRRALVLGLAGLGLVVTLGGVGIYFGAQMREAGDYPYTRALDDPSFMAESHFNPWRSPIAAHWRMLERNTALFVRGAGPRLTPSATTAAEAPAGAATTGTAATPGTSSVEAERLSVPASEVPGLTRALDFWWAYGVAAGLPRVPLLLTALALFVAALWTGARALAGVRALEVRPLPPAPDAWMA